MKAELAIRERNITSNSQKGELTIDLSSSLTATASGGSCCCPSVLLEVLPAMLFYILSNFVKVQNST